MSGSSAISPATLEPDRYTLVIVDLTAEHVLLAHDEAGRYALPVAKVPQFARTVEQLTSYILEHCGLRVSLLREPPSDVSSQRCAVFEAATSEPSEGLMWISVEEADSILGSRNDSERVSQLRQDIIQADSALTAPFGRLGWICDLQRWVQERAGVGQILSFTQLSGSESTCLVRFDTLSKSLWFKAVGQCDPAEFNNTYFLASRLPAFLPRILKFHPAWRAWLMDSANATSLQHDEDMGSWISATGQLARFQIESIPHVPDFLAQGCIDLRTDTLLSLVDPYCEFMNRLMQQQTKNPPAPLTATQIMAIADALRCALFEIKELHLPDVIGHSDLNPGNILVASDKCLFIDWSVAHVGAPILSFGNLAAHFRKHCSLLCGQDYRLRQTYQDTWSQTLSRESLHRCLELTPLLAVFATSIIGEFWRNPDRLALPGTPGYLRSMARIMYQETQQLERRARVDDVVTAV